MRINLVALLIYISTSLCVQAQGTNQLTLEVYEGKYATVNAFILSNGKSVVVLDALRKSDETKGLIEKALSKNLPITHLFISHGHTDHFTGMWRFRDQLPDTQIIVANENIRKDIKSYAIYMNNGGETEGEPALEKPLIPIEIDPKGFDYENTIALLNSYQFEIPGGGSLEVMTDFLPAEQDHMTVLYSKDLNALFLFDLAYNNIHPWLGDDISYDDVANWRTELKRIQERFADKNPIVYPGHGKPGDLSMLSELDKYLDDYVKVTKGASTKKQAYDEMIKRYPSYTERDFFLKWSLINHMRDKPDQ